MVGLFVDLKQASTSVITYSLLLNFFLTDILLISENSTQSLERDSKVIAETKSKQNSLKV